MTNYDYWQTFVGTATPEEFLRSVGTADPELGLERFLEERGHFCGVVNQGTWESTFAATEQYHLLSVRIYLQSYLEETREEWQPALEAQPPKVVRRYRPVYDLPVPATASEASDPENVQIHDAQADAVQEDVPKIEGVDGDTPPESPDPAPAEAVDEAVAAGPDAGEAVEEAPGEGTDTAATTSSAVPAEVASETPGETTDNPSDNGPVVADGGESLVPRDPESPAE